MVHLPTRLKPIYLIVLFDSTASSMLIPILPFIALAHGGSPLFVGLLAGTYSLCQFFSGPILGQISDRVGRKSVLVFSQMGTMSGLLLLAFSGNIYLILMARIIDGLTAGNIAVAQAHVADQSHIENRSQSLSRFVLSLYCGIFIGPSLGGLLSSRSSETTVLTAALLSGISSLLSILLLKNKASKSIEAKGWSSIFSLQSYGSIIRSSGTPTLIFQQFLYYSCVMCCVSGLAIFAGERFLWNGTLFGRQETAYLFAYFGLCGIIFHGFIMGKLLGRFGETRLVRMGFACLTLGFSGLGIAHDLVSILAAVTLIQWGSAAVRPSLSALLSRQVDGNKQGILFGLERANVSAAQIFGPLTGGFILNFKVTFAWAFWCSTMTGCGFLSSFFSRQQTAKFIRFNK